MDLATFEDGLDRYGADLVDWPPALRASAETLLERSAEAQTAQRALAEVELILRSTRVLPGGGDAMASRAMGHRQEHPLPRQVKRAAWVLALALALAVGLFVGVTGLDHGRGAVMASSSDSLGAVDVD